MPKEIGYYYMYVGKGVPSKTGVLVPNKKDYKGKIWYNMLIPHEFKNMVEGFWNVQRMLPKEISWHETIQPYIDWVDCFCEEHGGYRPKHLFHGKK